MTPNLSYTGGDLADLIARVEAATGKDRGLARDIQCKIGGWYRRTPSEGRTRHATFIHPDDCRNGKPVYDSLHGTDIWPDVPDVTSSLDAALALVERILPGWEIRATLHDPDVRLNNRDHTVDVGALGATPALALIAAALKALPLLDGGLGAARASRVHDGSLPIASEPPHSDGGAG